MYAVIEACGKQYKVTKGDVVFFEKLDAEEGKKVIQEYEKAEKIIKDVAGLKENDYIIIKIFNKIQSAFWIFI